MLPTKEEIRVGEERHQKVMLILEHAAEQAKLKRELEVALAKISSLEAEICEHKAKVKELRGVIRDIAHEAR